jgi:hypothetical protein
MFSRSCLITVLHRSDDYILFTQLEACAHSFFDDLRDPNARLPNGQELPPLFDFTAQGNMVIN